MLNVPMRSEDAAVEVSKFVGLMMWFEQGVGTGVLFCLGPGNGCSSGTEIGLGKEGKAGTGSKNVGFTPKWDDGE